MSTAAANRWYTAPEVADLLAVDAAKVRAWIARGELAAVDVAARQGGRPRWRVSQASLEAFLLRRQARPVVRPIRRRRQPPEVIQFF